jgi:hypothetical protein
MRASLFIVSTGMPIRFGFRVNGNNKDNMGIRVPNLYGCTPLLLPQQNAI